MPICRRPLALPTAFPAQRRVRLARYVLTRRIPPRAANDNRRPRTSPSLAWAVVLGTAPTLTALILISGLF